MPLSLTTVVAYEAGKEEGKREAQQRIAELEAENAKFREDLTHLLQCEMERCNRCCAIDTLLGDGHEL